MALGFYIAKGLQWLCLYSQINMLQAVGFSYLFTRMMGFGIALFYSYLAGFSIPTIRALLAIAFVLLCQFFRRHYTSWQYWWWIVLLLILFELMSLLSDSFWLSFLAVSSIILWYQFFPLACFLRQEKSKNLSKFNRLFLSLLHLQVGIGLVFLPVQLYFFEGISIFALVANLIIVPLYSFLLIPIILFSVLTSDFFSTWQLSDYLVQFSLWILEPLSHSWISLSYWQQWQLMLVDVSSLLFLYCKLNGFSYQKWLQIIVFSFLFHLSFYLYRLYPQSKTEWIIFDVGQGLAMALIYEKNKAIIYDTGASWRQKDGMIMSMAKIELVPYLVRQGISVEAIFLSHDDNDHSGGVTHLLQSYPRSRLISSSETTYNGIRPEACVKGKQWQFGNWHLVAVYPEKTVKHARNQDSCIILAQNDRLKLLFTGDTGLAQEYQFIDAIGKIDFLQVGHHGSKTSTSEALLAITQPQLAVVSAGRWNPWRLPNKQVMDRLKNRDINILNTAETGMIRMIFYQDSVKVEQARGEYSPWYKQFY